MINGKSVLAITLARGGSKGIPKKNIIDINGKPLLQYTVDEVKKSGYIDNYIVSTDDKTIHDICSKLNVNSFNRKPVSDTQSSADGLLEVIKHQDLKYDYVIDIMCTNPFKTIQKHL